MLHGSLFCDVVATWRLIRCISSLGEKDDWGSWFSVNVTLCMTVRVDFVVGVTMAVALGVVVDITVGSGSLILTCQLVSLLVWPPFLFILGINTRNKTTKSAQH